MRQKREYANNIINTIAPPHLPRLRSCGHAVHRPYIRIRVPRPSPRIGHPFACVINSAKHLHACLNAFGLPACVSTYANHHQWRARSSGRIRCSGAIYTRTHARSLCWQRSGRGEGEGVVLNYPNAFQRARVRNRITAIYFTTHIAPIVNYAARQNS